MFNFHTCMSNAFTVIILNIVLLASNKPSSALMANRPESFRDESDSLLTFSADPIYSNIT